MFRRRFLRRLQDYDFAGGCVDVPRHGARRRLHPATARRGQARLPRSTTWGIPGSVGVGGLGARLIPGPWSLHLLSRQRGPGAGLAGIGPESAAWRENRGRRGGSGCKEGVRRGAERSWKLREHRRGAPDDADGPSHPHLVWVGLQASAAECHGRWRIQVQGIDLTAGQGRACPARHVWAFPLMSRSICRPLRRMAATRPRGPSPGLERPCREGVSTS